jgi:integrase
MANRKVALVRYCKTDGGWRRYPVVMGGNGRVKPGVVLVNGKVTPNDTGHYELRYYVGSKLKYENVGNNAADALARCDRQRKLLAVKDEAKAAGATIVEEKGRRSLKAALSAFVGAAEDRGSTVAAKLYARAATEFLAVIGKVYADEVTVDDFSKFQRALAKRGLAARTISNLHKQVVSFVRFAGVAVETIPTKAPKYDKTLPEVYTAEQLTSFFASLTDDRHRVAFNILYQTGLREREAVFLQWADIDLNRGTLTVSAKPELGFRIKDREERAIPLGDGLVTLLRGYREKNPKKVFVIGTASDSPDYKLLRTLKRLVHNGGLNCGVCLTCRERNECEVWFLHKFRATFITSMLRNGVDLRTTMQLSGHSDIESVMRYLRPAEGVELRAKVNAIAWSS